MLVAVSTVLVNLGLALGHIGLVSARYGLRMYQSNMKAR
jgi:hypothetical protein